jgi:ethanolamine utilization microcompartment shell protein EutS
VAPSERPIVRQDSTSAAGDIRIGKGERKVLDVLAEYPDGRTYNELAFLAGYSAKASTLGVILSKLRQELCEQAGYSPDASTIGVILSKLRKLGLVEKGRRRVADEFAEAIA